MSHSKRDQALALAGVFQAASLVKQIANTGTANNAIVESSIETLFRFDADTVESVYGGLAGVGHGLRLLNEQIGTSRTTRDMEITRYVVSLLVLERKLAGNSKTLAQISDTLDNIQSQLEYFSLTHENTFAKLGELYKQTISTLGPKIIVTGEQPLLDNPHNASKVRALLLAGIRSAVLWRQCGGSRWHILFGRKKYLDESERMIFEL